MALNTLTSPVRPAKSAHARSDANDGTTADRLDTGCQLLSKPIVSDDDGAWAQATAELQTVRQTLIAGGHSDEQFEALAEREMNAFHSLTALPLRTIDDAATKLRVMLGMFADVPPEPLTELVNDLERFSIRHQGDDRVILDAFAERRRDFTATYHVDLTGEDEDRYFKRLDATERVIAETPAASIGGVIAKLLIAFMHTEGSAWADLTIMDTSRPDFVAGLADSGFYTRMRWSAIEDLARIGNVQLPRQEGNSVAPIPTPVSPFDALRLEYIDLDHRLNTSIPNDDDPQIDAVRARMNEIEGEMTREPSRSVEDAKTKLRFMLDTDRIGVPLDGEEAHLLMKDAARFLLGEEAGA